MDQLPDSPTPAKQEISLETLDQWEAELEEFAADIKRRFAMASLLIDAGESVSGERPSGTDSQSQPQDQAMDLLESIRKINQ